jgi:hypothetical protein
MGKIRQLTQFNRREYWRLKFEAARGMALGMRNSGGFSGMSASGGATLPVSHTVVGYNNADINAPCPGGTCEDFASTIEPYRGTTHLSRLTIIKTTTTCLVLSLTPPKRAFGGLSKATRRGGYSSQVQGGGNVHLHMKCYRSVSV